MSKLCVKMREVSRRHSRRGERIFSRRLFSSMLSICTIFFIFLPPVFGNLAVGTLSDKDSRNIRHISSPPPVYLFGPGLGPPFTPEPPSLQPKASHTVENGARSAQLRSVKDANSPLASPSVSLRRLDYGEARSKSSSSGLYAIPLRTDPVSRILYGTFHFGVDTEINGAGEGEEASVELIIDTGSSDLWFDLSPNSASKKVAISRYFSSSGEECCSTGMCCFSNSSTLSCSSLAPQQSEIFEVEDEAIQRQARELGESQTKSGMSFDVETCKTAIGYLSHSIEGVVGRTILKSFGRNSNKININRDLRVGVARVETRAEGSAAHLPGVAGFGMPQASTFTSPTLSQIFPDFTFQFASSRSREKTDGDVLWVATADSTAGEEDLSAPSLPDNYEWRRVSLAPYPEEDILAWSVRISAVSVTSPISVSSSNILRNSEHRHLSSQPIPVSVTTAILDTGSSLVYMPPKDFQELTRALTGAAVSPTSETICGPSKCMSGQQNDNFQLIGCNSLDGLPDFALELSSSSAGGQPLKLFMSPREYTLSRVCDPEEYTLIFSSSNDIEDHLGSGVWVLGVEWLRKYGMIRHSIAKKSVYFATAVGSRDTLHASEFSDIPDASDNKRLGWRLTEKSIYFGRVVLSISSLMVAKAKKLMASVWREMLL